jgi:hypothetical protein
MGLFFIDYKTLCHDLSIQFLNTWRITTNDQIFAWVQNKVVCINKPIITKKIKIFDTSDLELVVHTKEHED